MGDQFYGFFDGYVPFTAIQAFRTAPGVSVVNGAILGNAKVVVLFPPYVLETIEKMVVFEIIGRICPLASNQPVGQ